MEKRLALTGRQYRDLRNHLLPGDRLEAVALLLCGRGRGNQREQLVGRRLVIIPHDRLIIREPDRLEWPVDEFLLPLVEEMERDDLGVVVIHCHPQGGRFFSDADDHGDRSLFPSIHSWFDRDGAHAAAVMLPNGEIIARFVNPDGSFQPIDIVSVAGDDIKVFHRSTSRNVPEHALRLVQTFGQGTYHQLQRLKIAVVGCSGTGSIVAELLARNCIGYLVLVDDDRIEFKNLNRILMSTTAHATEGTFKVDALASAIESYGLGTQVEVHRSTLSNPAAARAVAECDVVFGCMDKLTGRHVLNSLCSAYCLPYFDTGVEIEPDGEGGISQAIADVHYIQPGGSSLMSRGFYSPDELTAEAWKEANPDYYNRQRMAGYLAKVQEDRPAVMPLNMVASNGAVIDLLARLHGFRLDPNSEFATQRWSLTHGFYEHGPDGRSCQFMARQVGLADNWAIPC
jgi:hypothetical protein